MTLKRGDGKLDSMTMDQLLQAYNLLISPGGGVRSWATLLVKFVKKLVVPGFECKYEVGA